jgi:hypothetical protein
VQVPRVGQGGGRREGQEAAGRILDREVSVRNLAVEKRAGVLAIDPDVTEASLAEEPPGRKRRAENVDRRGEREGLQRGP